MRTKKQPTAHNRRATDTALPASEKKLQRPEDKWSFAALGVVLIVAALIRSKFLLIPFERDEGIYGYMGTLLLEGKTPYVDFYEQKFPGLFYFYAMMVGVFGATVKGLHLGFMVLNLISITLIFLASRKLFNPFAGVISAITFAFVSLTPNLSGFTVQSEHGVAFFFCLGLYFFSLYYHSRRLLHVFLMGTAFALAFMTKTSGLFLLAWGGLSLLVMYFFAKERDFKALLKEIAVYAGATFLVIGLFFLLIIIKGSFSEMIYWTYTMPKSYVNKMPLEEGIKYFRYTRDAIVQNYKIFWIQGILAILLVLLRLIPWKMKVLVILLAAFSFLTIVPGYYFYGHYWIQVIPGLALLAGFSFYALSAFLGSVIKTDELKIRKIYTLVFVLFAINHIISQKTYYFHPNYDLILRQVYGSNPFPESMEIGKYLNANAAKDDKIVLIGSEPQIYFYTGKKSPSRHAYFSVILNEVPEQTEWQREFIEDVEAAKPRYLVYFNHSISLLVQPKSEKHVFEWANKYITENYRVVGVVDMVDGQLQSTYTWGQEAQTYQPKGQNVIYIFERTANT